VGSIVQHLRDHLPACAGVARSFNLNEDRNALFREEEVINVPPVTAARFVCDPEFLGDKEQLAPGTLGQP
jgi:hypothetical protein